MDPFKKSLGINFGPLFSVATQELSSESEKGEKNGAELLGDPPSRYPKRDRYGNKIIDYDPFVPQKPIPEDDWYQDNLIGIIIVNGKSYRIIYGEWYELVSNPLGDYVWRVMTGEPKGLPENWQNMLGGFFEIGGLVYKFIDGIWYIFDRQGSDGWVKTNIRNPIRSARGIHYWNKDGTAMTDEQVAQRNRELGINSAGGGSPSINIGTTGTPLRPPKYIDPAEKEGAYNEQFEPAYWDNKYPATEKEKALVRKAVEEIFNNKCLDNIPGLRDCLKKQWKETLLGFNNVDCMQREHSYKLGLGGHTKPKWYTGESISEMYLCRKNMTNKGKIDYTQLKAVLLHEMLHLCVGLRNLQEFDVYVIANMCDPNAFGKTNADYWPKTCESQNPPWGYEARERDFAPFRDPATGRYFWTSDKFLWDPVTGEVFLKERDPLNILQPYKLGKKMPIIWKCPR